MALNMGKNDNKKTAWTRDPEVKRRKVIDSATSLFMEHGYQAVTTVEIAQDAGISEALLFHYFGSKRGLAGTIADLFAARFSAVILQSAQPGQAPDIEAMTDRMFDFVKKHGVQITLLSDGGLSEVEQSYRQKMVKVIEVLCEQWAEGGNMEKANLSVIAELMYSIVNTGLVACFPVGRLPGKKEVVWRVETARAIRALLNLPKPL